MIGCQNRALCKFWSFDDTNKRCHMKDGRALMGRRKEENFYSGPRECDDTRYVGEQSFSCMSQFVPVEKYS